MLAMRRLPPVEYRALKTAFGQLVIEAGGYAAAETVTGYSQGRLNEAASPHRPDRMPRIDHVADLEQCSPVPLVTFHLARLSGHTLLPVAPLRGELGEALRAVLLGAGEVGAETVSVMADGAVSDAERAALRHRLQVLGRAVASAEAMLAEPVLRFGRERAA
jgi:hypothetical protein